MEDPTETPPVEAAESAEVPAAVETPKKLPLYVWIVVGLVATSIVSIVVSLALKKDDNKAADTTKSTPTSSPSSATSATPTAATKLFTVTTTGTKILPGGYADPTVVKTATGYRMYVNSFGSGQSGYNTFTSTDGVTWKSEKAMIIPGVATGRAVVLPTGIRFYYPGVQPIKPSDAPADMLSSFSTDGVTFKKDAGTILKPRSADYYVEGPTVFQLADKSWRMYFNENSVADGNNRKGDIWGATSTDGLTWTRDTTVTLQADGVTETGTASWRQALHPFVVTNPKGGYIMFYNAHSELYTATSTDGLTWKKNGSIGVHGADADGYFQADGSFRIYYGDYNDTEGGLVYTAVLTFN